MSTSSAPQSAVDQAEVCGWQVAGKKFVWEGTCDTTLTQIKWLGTGAVGQVWSVRAHGAQEEMVRKGVHFRSSKARFTRGMIEKEVENLKSVRHRHIVQVLGGYEEKLDRINSVLYILMYPVGDEDLDLFIHQTFSEGSVEARKQYRTWIPRWLHCLSSALAHMHAQGVHHEDIKPTNIIRRGDMVYFTDFSSSRRLDSHLETSTTSQAAATRLCAAPEVFAEEGNITRHGSKSDVFSLGVVFIELCSLYHDEGVQALRMSIYGTKDHPQHPYNTFIIQLRGWIVLASIELKLEDMCPGLVRTLLAMVSESRTSRPSPLEVSQRIARYPLSSCGCPSGDAVPQNFDEAVFSLYRPPERTAATRKADAVGWQVGLEKYVWDCEISPDSAYKIKQGVSPCPTIFYTYSCQGPKGAFMVKSILVPAKKENYTLAAIEKAIRKHSKLDHCHIQTIFGGHTAARDGLFYLRLLLLPEYRS